MTPSAALTAVSTPLLAASSAGHAVGWNALMALLVVVAVVRVVRRPAPLWRYGWWEKVAWLLAAVLMSVSVGHYVMVIGAPLALWRIGRPPRPPT